MRRAVAGLQVVLVVAVLAACGVDGTPETDRSKTSETLRAAPTTTTSAPFTVNGSGDASTLNIGSVEKWARDVAARDEATLIAKCWTFSETYVRQRYVGVDQALMRKALASTPGGGQAGVTWNDGGDPEVMVTWAEGRSDYACPKVTRPSDPEDSVPEEYVAHRVRRYILRSQGRPIRAGDTEAAYPLECNVDRGRITNVSTADPSQIAVTSMGAWRWTAVAGTVTFTLSYEPAEPCIMAAS